MPVEVVLICTERYGCGSVSVTLTYLDGGAPITVEKFGAEEWACREAARALVSLLVGRDTEGIRSRLVLDCCSLSWVSGALTQRDHSRVSTFDGRAALRGTLVEVCGTHSEKVSLAFGGDILRIDSRSMRSAGLADDGPARRVGPQCSGVSDMKSRSQRSPSLGRFGQLPRYEQIFRKLPAIL
jgi:hypothetical protein